MTAGSMLCLLGFVSVFWKQFRMPLIWLPLAAGACFAFEPVFRSLRLGQVNIILAVLVSVDCLALPRHRRGYLVGVAAGLKVTPGIFLLYLALQRDWRAVARGVTALAGSLAVSACIAPADTWHYWTDSLYNTTNVGSLIYGDNQSLTGVLARALRTEHPSSAIVLPASIAMLALGAMACHRELRRGEDAAGLICLAIGGLLASPIAWSHHWV
ncbi:MAG: alpha,2-mannosyltransferase, partial [Pseudonocardiales bacterium]|nr:alpha,2-mannosyltransferase [Pseudonocardiales bacterium]